MYPDWFQEHIETLSPLLDQKRKLYKQMLDHKQSEGSDYVDLVKRYKCVKNKVKNSICRIQNKWWSMKAEEMNQMHSCRDWKGLFDIWKKLSLNHSKLPVHSAPPYTKLLLQLHAQMSFCSVPPFWQLRVHGTGDEEAARSIKCNIFKTESNLLLKSLF